MKHCLLMTVYKDVTTINKFISSVPKDWGIFIHIDKKSNINEQDIIRYDYCIKEFTIYWGSWYHLYAFWLLLKKSSTKSYDYYHLVTGQDFYATPPSNFDKLLGSSQMNFIEIFPLPKKGWWNNGLTIYQFRNISLWADVRFGYAKNIYRLIYTLQSFFPIKRKLPNFKLYGGSVYCSLHHNFVKWIFKNQQVKKFLSSLKHCTCCEEIFFQTIIKFSPYEEKVVNNNLRYIDWSGPNPPRILDTQDYEKIINSKKLFCRKVCTKNILIHKIKKHINIYTQK